MLHILTMAAVRQIMYAFAFATNISQIMIFSRITFQKRRKFGYHFRCSSFYLLEENPLDFVLHNKKCKHNFSF